MIIYDQMLIEVVQLCVYCMIGEGWRKAPSGANHCCSTACLRVFPHFSLIVGKLFKRMPQNSPLQPHENSAQLQFSPDDGLLAMKWWPAYNKKSYVHVYRVGGEWDCVMDSSEVVGDCRVRRFSWLPVGRKMVLMADHGQHAVCVDVGEGRVVRRMD